MRIKRTIPVLAVISLCCYGIAQVSVKKVALYPWTFAENERGTSEGGVTTATDTLRKLFETRGGYEVIPSGRAAAAWKELGFPEAPLTVEELGQLPASFDDKQLLEFGRALGVDYVCAGTLGWRVRSVWVGLGPKTKADATVNVRIIDVKAGTVSLDVRDFSSASTKAEKWYESAGALLLTWGITLFSGGPKTGHIQKAAVRGIGGATDAFFSSPSPKKIGG